MVAPREVSPVANLAYRAFTYLIEPHAIADPEEVL